jgi:hypothetical protein
MVHGRVARATVPQYLPWAGLTVHVDQGNGGQFSHCDDWNRYAWDFGLARATAVQAGVPGIVVAAEGGCAVDRHDFTCHHGAGNDVKMRVSDGTCARYMHLETIAVARPRRSF